MKASFPEPEIVTRKGKPVSVILSIKDYEELVELAQKVTGLKVTKRKVLRPHLGGIQRRDTVRGASTGLPVSAGLRPFKATEVDELLAHLP